MKIKKILLLGIILNICMFSFGFAQIQSMDQTVFSSRQQQGSMFQRNGEKYFTGANGTIYIYVNIWGEITRSGTHMVYDGIDLVTLFSIAGGPRETADLSKIKIVRDTPDENGKLIYTIDFQKFIVTGERGDLPEIKPNDTILITEKLSSKVLSHINLVNTVLHIVQIYFQTKYYQTLSNR